MRYDEFTVGYRNEDLGAAIRLEGLLERRGLEAQRASVRLGDLYARRVARAAAGTALIAGFMLMAAETARTWLADRTLDHATPLLLGSWALGALVYGLTYLIMRARFPETLVPTAELGHGPRADMEQLESSVPDHEARARVESWEEQSVSRPMMGVALLAPLTIHWLLVAAFSILSGRPGLLVDFASFGGWIAVSLVVVGHCHLVLAFLARRSARAMRGLSTTELALRPHDGFRAYGWTVVSTLPVAILYLIPTIVVAVTGIVFIPALFSSMRGRVLAERMALAAS